MPGLSTPLAQMDTPRTQIARGGMLRVCQTRRAHRRCCVQATADGSKNRVAPLPVPTSAQETVEQATATVLRAYNEGVLRQRVQFLLPLIGATELDDWYAHAAHSTHQHHAQARRHPPAV